MDTSPATLSDKTICAIGRFAAMSQKEFRQFVRELGGQCAGFPTPETDYVIIGDEGCSDSSQALLKAWELRKARAKLEILSESDFYQRSGELPGVSRIVRRLTLSDLARSLCLPAARIRQWIRWELLSPVEVIHRLELFNFQAVATAKRLARLAENDTTLAKIRKDLDRLKHRRPGRSLLEGDLVERNGRLLIRHNGRLLDGGGQYYFDFWEGEDPAPILLLPPRAEDVGRVFEKALLAESSGRLDKAVELYQKALLLESANPILFFNLGNTLYAQGRYDEARDSFRKAIRLDDRYAEAWNNLGNVYLERECWQEAIEAFGQALKLVSDYQDARQNLELALNLLAEKRRTKIYP